MPDVTASTLIAADAAPTTPRDVWAFAEMLRPVWNGPQQNTTNWAALRDEGDSGAEQRTRRRRRPTRGVTLNEETIGVRGSTIMLQNAMRRHKSRWLAPICSDVSELTATATAGAAVLPCDTTLRRFFTGARVVAFSADSQDVQAFELGVIDSIAAGAITLTAPLAAEVPAGGSVIPLMEADTLFGVSGRARTPRVQVSSPVALEASGPMTLPGLETPGADPAGFGTYDGLPILSLPQDAAPGQPWGFFRGGTRRPLGLGTTVSPRASRAGLSLALDVDGLTRADVWPVIRFFDSRGGSVYPFWSLISSEVIRVTGVTSTTVITVQSIGNAQDWAARPAVGLITQTGEVLVRRISSVVQGVTEDELTLSDPLPVLQASSIRNACIARMCRFNGDESRESWTTSEICTVSLDVAEVVEERDVPTIFTTQAVTPLNISFDPLTCGNLPDTTPAPCIIPSSNISNQYRINYQWTGENPGFRSEIVTRGTSFLGPDVWASFENGILTLQLSDLRNVQNPPEIPCFWNVAFFQSPDESRKFTGDTPVGLYEDDDPIIDGLSMVEVLEI